MQGGRLELPTAKETRRRYIEAHVSAFNEKEAGVYNAVVKAIRDCETNGNLWLKIEVFLEVGGVDLKFFNLLTQLLRLSGYIVEHNNNKMCVSFLPLNAYQALSVSGAIERGW